LRGKFIEYVCADPKTQRELFPRQQKCLHIHGGQGLSQPLFFLDLWILLGTRHILCGRKVQLSDPAAWAPSLLHRAFLADGMRRMAAGQSEGELNPGQKG
jgi:hypothetical protein